MEKYYREKDQSFVVDMFHVTETTEQYAGQYQQLRDEYESNPAAFGVEVAAAIDEQLDILEQLKAIDNQYRSARTLAQAQAGDLVALERLELAERLCVPLREKLNSLREK